MELLYLDIFLKSPLNFLMELGKGDTECHTVNQRVGGTNHQQESAEEENI